MQGRLVGVLGERGQELAPRIEIEPVAQHIARAYEREARRRIARQRSGHEAIERFAYASRRARGQDLEFDLLASAAPPFRAATRSEPRTRGRGSRKDQRSAGEGDPPAPREGPGVRAREPCSGACPSRTIRR